MDYIDSIYIYYINVLVHSYTVKMERLRTVNWNSQALPYALGLVQTIKLKVTSFSNLGWFKVS